MKIWLEIYTQRMEIIMIRLFFRLSVFFFFLSSFLLLVYHERIDKLCMT